jgi:tetratricopeptide (TPR) repeat protein
MSLGDLGTALKELMILKDLAPDEAMVHFLLGRLYKGLREKGLAVRHFTIALNLDPKVRIPVCRVNRFHTNTPPRPASRSKRRSKVLKMKTTKTTKIGA